MMIEEFGLKDIDVIIMFKGDYMFWNRKDRVQKRLAKQKRKEQYDRVYKLHEEATFLCYIDDVYTETFEGKMCIKLIGSMAIGEGTVQDHYGLYSCEGRLKATIEIDEFYVGADSVNKLESSDKTVAIYPKQQDVKYMAGDMLCKPERSNYATNYE